jgi:predicted nucleic acid-binding protein
MPVYVADTNIYIVAANDATFGARFETFIRDHGPLLVSAIVVAEVLIGVASHTRHAAVVEAIGAGTEIMEPTADDWITAGTALARLGGDRVTKGRSFWNDALLAAQCARLGATLVTQNAADFRRLHRYVAVHAVPPFPAVVP